MLQLICQLLLWFYGYAAVRTLANAIEMVLTTVVLVYWPWLEYTVIADSKTLRRYQMNIMNITLHRWQRIAIAVAALTCCGTGKLISSLAYVVSTTYSCCSVHCAVDINTDACAQLETIHH